MKLEMNSCVNSARPVQNANFVKAPTMKPVFYNDYVVNVLETLQAALATKPKLVMYLDNATPFTVDGVTEGYITEPEHVPYPAQIYCTWRDKDTGLEITASSYLTVYACFDERGAFKHWDLDHLDIDGMGNDRFSVDETYYNSYHFGIECEAFNPLPMELEQALSELAAERLYHIVDKEGVKGDGILMQSDPILFIYTQAEMERMAA